VNFTPDILSSITAKVLIVHGDRDGFFPVSIPAEMHNSIPKSYLYVVPNGGHIPILGKNKSNFTQTALEFLRGMWEKKRKNKN
jgi:pimeloyl-ACP methyl ester carboxylesterase